MKIRDGMASINGDKTVYEMKSGGLEVIADDGRTLFDVTLSTDGSLHVSAGITCKHNGKILEAMIDIRPRASNLVYCSRPEYKEEAAQ